MTVISGSNERKTFLIARTRPSRREIMNETLCQYATHNNSSPLDQAIIHWHLILRHVSRSHRHQSFSPQTRKFSSCLFIFKQHSIHHRPSGNQRRKKHCRSERTFFFIFSSHAEIISPQHTTRQWWWWWWRCERKQRGTISLFTVVIIIIMHHNVRVNSQLFNFIDVMWKIYSVTHCLPCGIWCEAKVNWMGRFFLT